MYCTKNEVRGLCVGGDIAILFLVIFEKLDNPNWTRFVEILSTRKVAQVEVALNEKREEIQKLKTEITEIGDPDITSMTLEQLRELNRTLAEDVKLLG